MNLLQRRDLAGSVMAAGLHANLIWTRASVKCGTSFRRGQGAVSKSPDPQLINIWKWHINMEHSVLCFAGVQLGT